MHRGVLTRALVLVALLLLGAWGHAASAATLDAEAVENVIAVDRQPGKSHAQRRGAIGLAFNELQPDYQARMGDLPGTAPDKLEILWRLASFMTYATDEFRFASDMLALHDEYARRKITPPAELRGRLLQSLIAFRRFDAARAYAAKAELPLEYIPPVEGAAQGSGRPLSVLKIDAARGVLRREDIQVDDEVHVFVLSFIGCVFSRRAADAIENHAVLGPLMRERSTWLLLPGPLYFNDVLAWNRSHPSTGFAYMDGMEAWDFVDDRATPTFYVVRGGRVVAKLQGWADDAAGSSALLEALAAHGPAAKTAQAPGARISR